MIPEYLIQDLEQQAIDESQENATAQEAGAIYAEKEDHVMEEKTGTASTQFSEADVANARLQGKKDAQAEFAEQQRQDRITARKKRIANFCESLQKKGNFKLIPALDKLGVKQFMDQLSEIDAEVEFSEGNKQTMTAWFEDFLNKALPDQSHLFDEHAKRGNAVEVTDETQREKLIHDFMEGHKDVTYKDALIEVSISHPKLFERR